MKKVFPVLIVCSILFGQMLVVLAGTYGNSINTADDWNRIYDELQTREPYDEAIFYDTKTNECVYYYFDTMKRADQMYLDFYTNLEFLGFDDNDGYIDIDCDRIKMSINDGDTIEYVFKHDGTNGCTGFQYPPDLSTIETWEDLYKTTLTFVGIQDRSTCEDLEVKEGRWLVEYVSNGSGDDTIVYKRRGTIVDGSFQELDRIEITKEEIVGYSIRTFGTYQEYVEYFLRTKNFIESERRALYENEKVGGIRENMVFPNESITRGEMASMIVLALNIADNHIGENFSDVSISHKNSLDILTLKNNNVVYGKTGGFYDPDGFVTRAEMVSIITRAMFSLGIDQSTFDTTISNEVTFFDVASDSVHAINIKRLGNLDRSDIEGKVFNGYKDGGFKPERNINRHEASIISLNARQAFLYWLRRYDPVQYSKFV